MIQRVGRRLQGAVISIAVALLSGAACERVQAQDASHATTNGKLRIFFVDVEGGQATLFVSPSGESLLIDAGWPGNDRRDANRIVAAAKEAGLKKTTTCSSRTITTIMLAAFRNWLHRFLSELLSIMVRTGSSITELQNMVTLSIRGFWLRLERTILWLGRVIRCRSMGLM